MLRLSM